MTEGLAQADIGELEQQREGVDGALETLLMHMTRLGEILSDRKRNQQKPTIPLPFESSGRPRKKNQRGRAPELGSTPLYRFNPNKTSYVTL
jgi:hypothetical protein